MNAVLYYGVRIGVAVAKAYVISVAVRKIDGALQERKTKKEEKK